MFPTAMQKYIDAAVPQLNPQLAHGLAMEHLKYVEEYVDSVFRSAAIGFPPGMTYDGCRRCTPQEEYQETTRKKGSRCVFDVARSDVYLMEYKFSYNREPLPSKYMYLPFVGDGGVIYLGGSRFVISPILSDRVISIGIANVFVRLLKAKLTFNRIPHSFTVNGVNEFVQVAWSAIYNEKQNDKAAPPTVKANCTLAHYLFCKYGFSQTFKKFANCEPIVGYEEINPENYPPHLYNICYSTQIKPKGFGKSYYEPSVLRVAVLKTQYTPMVKNLLGGFFYACDHFPTRIVPQYVNHPRLWMILLGHLIWSGNVSEGKLYSDVEDHIASLDEYIDSLVHTKLKDIGFPCNDIYELLALIIDRFNDWLLSGDDRVNTVYDKELSILYYVCYDITKAIFLLYFKLKAAQKKELNLKKIAKIMSLNLRTGIIFKITREHGEVTTTSSSGDNKALKTTILLVPQSSSNRNKSKKDRIAISDPGKRIHASLAEVCQFSGIPKSDPSSRSRLNLFVDVGNTGLVMRNPKHTQLIADTQKHFKR